MHVFGLYLEWHILHTIDSVTCYTTISSLFQSKFYFWTLIGQQTNYQRTKMKKKFVTNTFVMMWNCCKNCSCVFKIVTLIFLVQFDDKIHTFSSTRSLSYSLHCVYSKLNFALLYVFFYINLQYEDSNLFNIIKI